MWQMHIKGIIEGLCDQHGYYNPESRVCSLNVCCWAA